MPPKPHPHLRIDTSCTRRVGEYLLGLIDEISGQSKIFPKSTDGGNDVSMLNGILIMRRVVEVQVLEKPLARMVRNTVNNVVEAADIVKGQP